MVTEDKVKTYDKSLDLMKTGEMNLPILLKTMRPKQNTGTYVFCSVTDVTPFDLNEIVCMFREEEGTTIIVTQQYAEKRLLSYSFVATWITLSVQSSLDAVGLTAAFSTALAKEGISCNVVAGFFHDHLFVPQRDSDKAMEILQKLSASFVA